MYRIKVNSLGSGLLITLIIFNCISYFSKNIFNIYEGIAFYGNLMVLVLIVLIKGKVNKFEMRNYAFLLVFTIYGLFTLVINDGGIGSIVVPVYGFLTFIVFNIYKVNERQVKILLVTFIILNLYLVLNSNNYFEKSFYNYGQYINSNTIGMVLLYTAIYIKIFSYKLKIRFQRIISFIIYLLSIVAILNTQSRGAVFTLILFIFLDTLIPKNFWRNRRTTLTVFIAVIVSGTIFPFLYTLMYVNGIEYNIPFTSKDLYTGREVIWQNFFIEMSSDAKNWFLGLGSNAELWIGQDLNVHNNYLAILTNFGLFGYFLYHIFIIIAVRTSHKGKYMSEYQISLLIGFLCVLVSGFVEASILWFMMFFFNFMFLGLINNDYNSQRI